MRRQYRGLFSSHERTNDSEGPHHFGGSNGLKSTAQKASGGHDNWEQILDHSADASHEERTVGSGDHPLNQMSVKRLV